MRRKIVPFRLKENRVPTQIAFSNSLSDCKFSLCQFTSFVTMTYTNLTWQTYPLIQLQKYFGEFSRQILKYLLPLEPGNLQLEQTKLPVFRQNFQIPCFFPDRDFFLAIFNLSSVQWVPWIRKTFENRKQCPSIPPPLILVTLVMLRVPQSRDPHPPPTQ